MSIRKLVLLSFSTISLLGVAGQAHAFNLLIAVGNAQIQVVVIEESKAEIVKVAKPAEIIIEDIEPASG